MKLATDDGLGDGEVGEGVVTKHADHGPTGLGVYWWQLQSSSSLLEREAFVQIPESGEKGHCIRL